MAAVWAPRWNTTERVNAQNSPDSMKIKSGDSHRQQIAATAVTAPESTQEDTRNRK